MTRYYTTILALGKFSLGITDMTGAKAKRCTACFFILLFIDVLDLVCDWLFFTDVYLIQKGLVFGPHDESIVCAVLVFTIVGTVDFPLQMYVTSQETLNATPNTHQESRLNAYNLLILVLEDLPQAVLLVLVSLCREDPSSIWGITKASFILLTSLIKLVPNVTACCKKFSCAKTIILIGAFLELSMSVTVFIITQAELTNGGLRFYKPTTIMDDRFNYDLYLSDVSLFIHDPNFLPKKESAMTPMAVPTKSLELNWFRLDYLRHIQKFGHSSLRLEYQKSEYYDDVVKLRVWEKDAYSHQWSVHGCYTISTSTGNVEIINPVYLSCSISEKKAANLYLTFKFVEPEPVFKKHIMGDITFNARYQKPGGTSAFINKTLHSSYFSSNVTAKDNKYTERDFDGTRITTPILIHYFRPQSVAEVSSTRGYQNDNVLVTKNGGKITGHLYQNKNNQLIDVKDIWKTGWRKCPSTGNLGPRFDADIKVAT